MCIAIVKLAGVPVPPLSILEACADSNSDGAGIAYPCVGGGVQIIKGIKEVKVIHETLTAQDFTPIPLMIHFRIGTHGLKSDPRHTHPFPVGASTEAMEELVHQCEFAVMHNGILGAFGYDKKVSDTMAYARDFLGHVVRHIDNPGVRAAIDKTLSWDKLAIMDPTGSVTMFGKWIESEGVFYSNESFRSFGGADPRKWGSCSRGWGSLSAGEYELEDDDIPFRPFHNQLWSDNLFLGDRDTLDGFDVTHLRSDASSAEQLGAAVDCPKPPACTDVEFDAWVVYGYLTKKFTDKQLYSYLETGVVIKDEPVATTKKDRRIRRQK